MADLADAVADALAEVDPDGADDLRRQRQPPCAPTSRPSTRSSPTGSPACERDTVVVSHDAFGYLERYGLHFEGIAGLTPDAEPTPAVLADLQDLIADEGITTVFSERLASPAMAESLASDAGVDDRRARPDRGTWPRATPASDYVALMEQNLAALQEANGC